MSDPGEGEVSSGTLTTRALSRNGLEEINRSPRSRLLEQFPVCTPAPRKSC